ncbi:MAG: divalent-cation tolerance protein CutA [Nitrospira sp.]|nr:divalent-cation tolerance protein CutA [Nitrospira sp.]
MAEATDEIVVFVTAASQEEAARIGRRVVEEGLAACANILPGVRSIFSWEGKISEEQESLMILKSRAGLFEDLATVVKSLHSYSVPEIIAIPIVKGADDYLSWLGAVTGKSKK